MGVIYKLKDEVVHFIISEKQSNPLYSCRQLAESASAKFSLHLSKSSVHDVLKESGIITPRGRKPKDKFEIPQEKKKQIQSSLSQAKLLLPSPARHPEERSDEGSQQNEILRSDLRMSDMRTFAQNDGKGGSQQNEILHFVQNDDMSPLKLKMSFDESVEETILLPYEEHKPEIEISPEYEGAGKIFLKAALWDLGLFSEENIKPVDWEYYLTYTKGVKVLLENDKSFFIEMSLPIERCIKEVADALVSNIRPFLVDKVSDEELLKDCMDAQLGSRMQNIYIVDQKDHNMFEISNIVDLKRNYEYVNMLYVESVLSNPIERARKLFFSESIDNNTLIEKIQNINGFDAISKSEYTVTLLIQDSYELKTNLLEAIEKLNSMYMRDEQNRLVKVKIESF